MPTTDPTRGMVRRLSNYRRVLQKLRSLGFVRVFSDNLGDALGISSSQVRKDFSQFRLTGKRRGGYQVEELIGRLNEILGKNEPQKVIIVGCGKIGTALMNYTRFASEGIRIVAGFDVDPGVVNPDAPIPIYYMSSLAEVVAQEQITVAVITVPESMAQDVFECLREAGVRGVLNFTPATLRGADGCIVQHVNIQQAIENVFYTVRVSENGDGRGSGKRDGETGMADG